MRYNYYNYYAAWLSDSAYDRTMTFGDLVDMLRPISCDKLTNKQIKQLYTYLKERNFIRVTYKHRQYRFCEVSFALRQPLPKLTRRDFHDNASAAKYVLDSLGGFCADAETMVLMAFRLYRLTQEQWYRTGKYLDHLKYKDRPEARIVPMVKQDGEWIPHESLIVQFEKPIYTNILNGGKPLDIYPVTT
jgi:hypothetical protein